MPTAVANINEAPRRSLLVEMAGRYGMEPKAFSDTLRATVVPPNTTNEEFAAFLMVAREYELNPVLKEIYAFPKRGGGIQPIVSIDGWCNLINSHPQLNGIEFDDHIEGDKVTAITARIWRKDREKPIIVTEYLAECQRSTDTWRQYPRRMLRHKALIQCARYAFGLAGIVDPDEAERMVDVTPTRDEPPAPPPVASAPPLAPVAHAQVIDNDPPAPVAEGLAIPNGATDPEAFLKWIDASLATVADPHSLETVWNDTIVIHLDAMFPPDQEEALGLYRKHEKRLAP